MKAQEIYQSLHLKERLPTAGIVAFSACSVNSVASLFLARAKHPTPALWLAAGLVEIVTAWVIYQVVENARKVTRSNISKQDRKFYGLILAAFTLLAVPPLVLSVTANAIEFGNLALGFIFPLLSVACAIGSALPETVTRFERQSQAEKAQRAAERAQRKAERAQREAEARIAEAEAEAEARRRETERQQREAERAQSQAEKAQRETERRQALASLGETGRQIFDMLAANGPQNQTDLAQALGVTRQTVGYHVKHLEGLSLVERNNGQGIKAK